MIIGIGLFFSIYFQLFKPGNDAILVFNKLMWVSKSTSEVKNQVLSIVFYEETGNQSFGITGPCLKSR